MNDGMLRQGTEMNMGQRRRTAWMVNGALLGLGLALAGACSSNAAPGSLETHTRVFTNGNFETPANAPPGTVPAAPWAVRSVRQPRHHRPDAADARQPRPRGGRHLEDFHPSRRRRARFPGRPQSWCGRLAPLAALRQSVCDCQPGRQQPEHQRALADDDRRRGRRRPGGRQGACALHDRARAPEPGPYRSRATVLFRPGVGPHAEHDSLLGLQPERRRHSVADRQRWHAERDRLHELAARRRVSWRQRDRHGRPGRAS